MEVAVEVGGCGVAFIGDDIVTGNSSMSSMFVSLDGASSVTLEDIARTSAKTWSLLFIPRGERPVG